MKTIKDLCEAIRNGQKPVVTFKKAIEDKESYAEPGMRARILSVAPEGQDDVIRIMFDFEEFDAHNVTLESSNYYDKSGAPTLNAKQAGFYKPQEQLYFDLSEVVDELMTVEGDTAVQLFNAYKAENTSLSYVQWLESKLVEAQTRHQSLVDSF